MRGNHPLVLAAAGVLAFGVAACSSTSSTTAKSASSGTRPAGPASTTTAPQVEVNPPGDIPDNQAFVAFHGSGFTVTVPEGWSQTTRAGAVVFADKYNSITIGTLAANVAPTVVSARSHDVAAIRAHATGFVPGAVSSVTRTSGSAVRITYQAQSPVNPVTGKVVIQASERYEFWRAGRAVVLTLAAPVGSDNVDPWRTVTDSFAWTGK